MSETNNAPSPVIRYFLPGLVLGAVLGGTLATVLPELTSSPASRAEFREPGAGDGGPEEGARDPHDELGTRADEMAEQAEELADDAQNQGAEMLDDLTEGLDSGNAPEGGEGG